MHSWIHVGIGRSTLHQYLRSLVLGHCTLALSDYTPALLLHVHKFIIFNEISKVEKTKHPEFSLDIVKCDPTSSTWSCTVILLTVLYW